MRTISPIRGLSVTELFKTCGHQRAGMYPVGENNFWHGGIHIKTDKPVVAIAPGKLIAYRITRKCLQITLQRKKYDYSSSFVLLEHSYISPRGTRLRFYSLYMHLLPVEMYEATDQRPIHLTRTPYTVTAADAPPAGVNGQPGLHVRGAPNATAIVTRVIPQQTRVYLRLLDPYWAMVVDGEHPSQDTSEYVLYGGNVEELASEPFVERYDQVASTKLTVEAGDLMGYPGPYMSPAGQQKPVRMIHFEVFADESLLSMISSTHREGSDIIRVNMARALRKGLRAYLKPPPQTLVIGAPPNAQTIDLKIGANSKLFIVGDPRIDSRYIECKVAEMTRVVPTQSVIAPPSGYSYSIQPTLASNVSAIFDGFAFNTHSDHLEYRWACLSNGSPVYPPQTSNLALFTFKVPPSRRTSLWVARSALGDLRFKEKQISHEITAVYLTDPDAYAFDETIEGLSVEEYLVDKDSVHMKLDTANDTWYEIEVPYIGDNIKTVFKLFLDDIGIKWTPREKGWVRATPRNELKASTWPGYIVVEETGASAGDGFCDFDNLSDAARAIFKEIDTSKDGVISEDELTDAAKDPNLSYKLMRCICHIPSEWHADTQLSKWQRLNEIIKDQGDRTEAQEQIRKLIWWDNVAQLVSGFPSSPIVYHIHPLAFITHMAKLPYCVWQLQRSLRTVGFEFVGEPSGTIDRNTELALREFLVFSRMAQVARVRDDAPRLLQHGADIAAQQGENGNLSAYCASLEQVANTSIYNGPLGASANKQVVETLHTWLDHRWRCPLVVEAWETQRATGNRIRLYKSGVRTNVNIWRHDEVPVYEISGTHHRYIRIFAKDFSGYYDIPVSHQNDPMYILGRYNSSAGWGGPVNTPPVETWPEAEVLPINLVGQQNLVNNTRSTFKAVRAVAEVECYAFFDCLNAWDRGLLSTGPCHWILGLANQNTPQGVVSPGELGAYLSYFASKEPEAFHRGFRFFGLSVAEKWHDGRGNGASLVDPSHQRKFVGSIEREDGDGVSHRVPNGIPDWHYYHTWPWIYRFQMAARTIDAYRRRMWDMARMRIRDIRRSLWGANGPWGTAVQNVTIGDVFTSERAIAMIHRWHVNAPAGIIANDQAAAHIRNALNNAMSYQPPLAPNAWQTDPAQWGNEHEARLIRGIVDEAATITQNQWLLSSINDVHNWPSWGSNLSHYTLTNPIEPLSAERNSFSLDETGLPPVVS